MSLSPSLPSPYAQAPIRVAHAFVAGQDAQTAAECPFDRQTARAEYEAWHRGFRLAQRLRTER